VRPVDRTEIRRLKRLFDARARAELSRAKAKAEQSHRAYLEQWRECGRCRRERRREEFSNGSRYCRPCESKRVSEAYHRRKAAA
jgi:hypothetical protein